MYSQQVCKGIEKHFSEELAEIQTLVNQAQHDLHFGSNCEDDEYPGFISACRQIREWIDANISTIYVDENDYIHTSEPQGMGGECPECSGQGYIMDENGESVDCDHPECDQDDTFPAPAFSEIDSSEIVKILFGELAQYVR